jgi:hypothetical protein
VRLGDGTLVRLAKNVTVFDDADLDLLSGDSGRDWFFQTVSEDRRSDRRGNEEQN